MSNTKCVSKRVPVPNWYKKSKFTQKNPEFIEKDGKVLRRFRKNDFDISDLYTLISQCASHERSKKIDIDEEIESDMTLWFLVRIDKYGFIDANASYIHQRLKGLLSHRQRNENPYTAKGKLRKRYTEMVSLESLYNVIDTEND